MQETRFYSLLEQYITDAINEEDLRELYALLDDPYYKGLWEKTLEQEWEFASYEEPREEMVGQLIEQHVLERIRTAKVVPMRRPPVTWMRSISAAAILVMILAGAIYLVNTGSKKGKERSTSTAQVTAEIPPGKNKAILELGNGQQINLDGVKPGLITSVAGARITKMDQGLVYERVGKTEPHSYHTLRTPKGGQYHIRLEDGTEVWLNAASSLRFPAAFATRQRNVEITGEAYFEVAHQRSRPFLVSARGMQVQVLGTHFNINTYENEPALKATLLQGSIKITTQKESALLSPGEQAQVNAHDEVTVVKGVNVEEAVSWKNGYFTFTEADVPTVMRQVERWYDLEAVFGGNSAAGHFNGTIPRNITASNLIRILNAGGIACTLEGRKILLR